MYHAYVDESGDPQLDVGKHGVSRLFVLTAILASDEDVGGLRTAVDAVRLKHFASAEMKSSVVGSDHGRREAIVCDLGRIDFRFVSLVVHKSDINSASGFRYKRTFLKWFHRRLYERLYGAHRNIRIRADEHGRQEFMDGFRKYVDDRFKPTLFDRVDFDFVSSEDEVLVQLADFVSGTLTYVVEPGKSEHSSGLIGVLGSKCFGFDEYPFRPRPLIEPSSLAGDMEVDRLVCTHCLQQAGRFLDGYFDDSNPQIRAQVAVLRRLAFHAQMTAGDNYVSTSELARIAERELNRTVSARTLRSGIIAKLRDGGVLITGARTRTGYRIPSSLADIHQFVEHAASIVGPMLSRVEEARKQIGLLTNATIDIVDRPGLELLRFILDNQLGALGARLSWRGRNDPSGREGVISSARVTNEAKHA